jgi:hypothetical protein
MEDPRATQLKAQYNQVVMSVARNTYLKAQELIRDLNEAKIRDEDKNEIRLHLVKMVTTKPTEINKS